MGIQLDQLFETPEVDEHPPIIIDRSTLERWSACPTQAHYVDAGKVMNTSKLADVGSEVHRILSEACTMRCVPLEEPVLTGDEVERGQQLGMWMEELRMHAAPEREIRDFISSAGPKSRPDIQPDVLWAIKRVAYTFAGLLCHRDGDSKDRHPNDLLRFDGGRGKRSGQLAWDIEPATETRGPVRLTSEIDLLLATASEAEVAVIDSKSGHKWWTPSMVQESFQFQEHATLIMMNYPKVQRVSVQVLMTRENQLTSAVYFDRDKDFFNIQDRLRTAVKVYLKYRGLTADQIAAWPAPDKCSICPVAGAALCPHVLPPVKDIAADTPAAIDRLIVLNAEIDAIKAVITPIARLNGDIRAKSSDAMFGTGKPKSERAPTCGLYTPAPGEKPETPQPLLDAPDAPQAVKVKRRTRALPAPVEA